MEMTITKIMNGYLLITPKEDGNLIWYSPDMVGVSERLGRVYREDEEPTVKHQKKAKPSDYEEEY